MLIQQTEIVPQTFDEVSNIFYDATAKYDFHNGLVQPDTYEGVKYLWLSVLEQAIIDYQEFFKKKDKRFNKTFNWFFNQSHDHKVGSLNFICDIFGISRGYILKGLTSWTRKQAALNQRKNYES